MTDLLDVAVADGPAMQSLGEVLASWLRAGDLVVLSGRLGAGKTTLTQGIGSGLGVRGPVTSPTFVIARVHPSLVGGPALVHVDAYRLGDAFEVDDLDLDASMHDSVTVVEWGARFVDALGRDRLVITLSRATDDRREAKLHATGPRSERIATKLAAALAVPRVP